MHKCYSFPTMNQPPCCNTMCAINKLKSILSTSNLLNLTQWLASKLAAVDRSRRRGSSALQRRDAYSRNNYTCIVLLSAIFFCVQACDSGFKRGRIARRRGGGVLEGSSLTNSLFTQEAGVVVALTRLENLNAHLADPAAVNAWNFAQKFTPGT
jgi:hypothetical protein